ncbi:hypothetical protein BBJ28_00008125 [Nothophytophthora sp. Chile5]|nr:hypothetical protein BBJ28_00008125 [Nothophytophthora sp. Chile5]
MELEAQPKEEPVAPAEEEAMAPRAQETAGALQPETPIGAMQKSEDDEVCTTDTSRNDDDDDDDDAAEGDVEGEGADTSGGVEKEETTEQPRDRVTRAASFSSSSGAGSASSAASQARRSITNARASNPLRGDTNLKIFLPSDNLALKAILSPQTPRSPSRTASEGDVWDAKTAAATANTSANLFDKLLFRGNGAPVQTAAKKSVGSLVEEDLEAMNVVVMNSNLPPPPFANMFACESCRDDIGTLLSKGRHHCRNCGGSFCAECSKQTIVVPFQAYLSRGELRVCDGCFHRIQNFQSQVKSSSVTWSGLPPPSSEDIERDFRLADGEAPVSIFNCALFQDATPFYGHLVLTRKRLCFQGYADSTKRKVAYSQIMSLLKPQFYYINGLQVKTKRKETFFLAEFNGLRDMCFLRLDQLIRAYQEASKLKDGGCGKSPSSKELRKQALGRRRSYKLIAEHMASASGSTTNGPPLSSSSSAMLTPPLSGGDSMANFTSASSVSTVGYIDVDEDEEANAEVPLSDILEEGEGNCECTDDGKSSTSDEEPFEPLPPDPLLEKMTVLLDCDMRADVKRVFDLLWNDGPGQEFLFGNMEKSRDIDIDVGSWQAVDRNNPEQMEEVRRGFEISKEEDYTLFRQVKSQHPPKISFPGLPAYAGCTRMQRFRLDKSSQGGDKWDRFVVSELNRMSKIPFSDYFEVESRFVVSRDGKNYCHVQVGLVVNFRKATWFKSQINSSTRSESKEALEAWAKQAIEFLEAQRNRAVSLSPKLGALSTSDSFSELESVSSGSPPARKRSHSSTRSVIEQAWSAAAPPASSKTVAVGSEAAMEGVRSPRSLVQWLLLGLLLYCLVLLRGQHTQMQQLTVVTTKLLQQLQEQQTQMQTQNLKSCEGGSVADAMQTLQQFVDASTN